MKFRNTSRDAGIVLSLAGLFTSPLTVPSFQEYLNEPNVEKQLEDRTGVPIYVKTDHPSQREAIVESFDENLTSALTNWSMANTTYSQIPHVELDPLPLYRPNGRTLEGAGVDVNTLAMRVYCPTNENKSVSCQGPETLGHEIMHVWLYNVKNRDDLFEEWGTSKEDYAKPGRSLIGDSECFQYMSKSKALECHGATNIWEDIVTTLEMAVDVNNGNDPLQENQYLNNNLVSQVDKRAYLTNAQRKVHLLGEYGGLNEQEVTAMNGYLGMKLFGPAIADSHESNDTGNFDN